MNYLALPNIHRAQPGEYKIGDHLFYDRAFSVPGLSHHAVYTGNGEVVHYWGDNTDVNSTDKQFLNATVQKMPIKTFELLAAKKGETIYVIDHPFRLPRKQTVQRCLQALGQSGYCPFTNNCESFVNFCVLGNPRSLQVESLNEKYNSMKPRMN